eukprot:TRINITY_DN6319_c0_g1_i1.p1 TRINITY_DN6319_c0_g1~~TRINITY_DN6319_c0_g1_i1.p1  ORF type:complete len:162 (+),score=22.95 TRINITY_DN6319_c0_g1_i1:378-863(+)
MWPMTKQITSTLSIKGLLLFSERTTRRLKQLGSEYGSLEVHSGLLDNAIQTERNPLYRIGVTSLVNEGRGLDSGPRLLQKLLGVKDRQSHDIIKKILHEEVRHVNIGVKWFTYLCKEQNLDPNSEFQKLIAFLGIKVMPPFNLAARDNAGIPREWYSHSLS